MHTACFWPREPLHDFVETIPKLSAPSKIDAITHLPQTYGDRSPNLVGCSFATLMPKAAMEEHKQALAILSSFTF